MDIDALDAKTPPGKTTPSQYIEQGYVLGEDFYIDHSNICRPLKPNSARKCQRCTRHQAAKKFYSHLHPFCRTCMKRKEVEPGSLEDQMLALKQGSTNLSPKQAVVNAQSEARRAESYEPRTASEVTGPQKELASRILARRRLVHFIQRFQPGYQAGWVHEDICRRLERFMKNMEEGKSPRMLIFCPPRLGKSLIASQFFPAWMLGHHPEWEIIAASYNITLPIGFSRRIRETVRDPAYSSMFRDTRVSEESQAVEAWRTTKGGGYAAAGVGTGITGKGAHCLIIDDPIKDWEAADSANVRESTWEWYLSTAYTRIAPGGGVLGIQTRWNDDDWAGRVILAMQTQEGEAFEVVSYSAINEQGDEYMLENDDILQIAPGETVPPGAKLLRTIGSALHPARYDIDYLTRVKRNFLSSGNLRMWSALYQQNPVPDEGAFFRKEMFRYYNFDPITFGRHIYQSWDFSITQKEQSDWIVGACFMQDEYDNVYELDMVRFKVDEDSFALADAVIAFHEKWSPWIVGFEDGQIWKSIKSVIMRRAQERNVTLNFETLQPLTDKLVRAGPMRGRMQMGRMYFRENAHHRQTVDQEFLRFPAGKHDDIVDAYSWCMRLILAHAPPSKPQYGQKRKVKSWKDKIAMTTKGASHMAN